MYSIGRLCILFAFLVICDTVAQHQAATGASSLLERATPPKWRSKFTPDKIEAQMHTQANVQLEITDFLQQPKYRNYRFQALSEKPLLASVDFVLNASDIDPVAGRWLGNITIDLHFLGATKIFLLLAPIRDDANTSDITERSPNELSLVIVREVRIIDHIFTGSVITLVSLFYINFGAALDMPMLRQLVARPTAPAIGFFTQFAVMPLLSYALGYAFFPDSPEMQIGLFFTGVSPSGGASNVWSVLLGGNITLSVLMTSLSNFAAFLMMPFWLFTLGKLIFDRGGLAVPYERIATLAFSLLIPLAIGIAIQRYCPRLCRALVRLLKPASVALISFIVVFAVATNLYLFQLFSWQIVVAGLGLPFFGYVIAWIMAKTLRQNSADALTIAIETGIQNTGIAIFALRVSLQQPQADLTTIIPVSVAIFTPLPLLLVYMLRRRPRVVDGVADNSDDRVLTRDR